MRLIDADALEPIILWQDYEGYVTAYRDTEIDNAPTIEAVEVVRCKECRYKDTELCAMYRLVVAGVRKYDDYCSYGERKESE